MTLLGRLASFFPIMHVLSIFLSTLLFIKVVTVVSFLLMLFFIYLMPPLLFRLYCLKYPARAGRWVLSEKKRCDWWIAHQLQMTYAIAPCFEAILRLVPGVYSSWLRLWGSKVGKRVYWTVSPEIIDRHMLRIGDDVMFGHRVICTAHVVTRRPSGELVLIQRPVRIGSGSFIGALSRLGPGVRIPAKTTIPFDTEYRFAYAK